MKLMVQKLRKKAKAVPLKFCRCVAVVAMVFVIGGTKVGLKSGIPGTKSCKA